MAALLALGPTITAADVQPDPVVGHICGAAAPDATTAAPAQKISPAMARAALRCVPPTRRPRPISTTACSWATPSPISRRSPRSRKPRSSIPPAPCAPGAKPGRAGRRSTIRSTTRPRLNSPPSLTRPPRWPRTAPPGKQQADRGAAAALPQGRRCGSRRRRLRPRHGPARPRQSDGQRDRDHRGGRLDDPDLQQGDPGQPAPRAGAAGRRAHPQARRHRRDPLLHPRDGDERHRRPGGEVRRHPAAARALGQPPGAHAVAHLLLRRPLRGRGEGQPVGDQARRRQRHASGPGRSVEAYLPFPQRAVRHGRGPDERRRRSGVGPGQGHLRTRGQGQVGR